MIKSLVSSIIGAIVVALLGWWVGFISNKVKAPFDSWGIYFIAGGVTVGFGLPFVIRLLNRWMRNQVIKI